MTTPAAGVLAALHAGAHSKDVLRLDADATYIDALRALKARGVSGAPVFTRSLEFDVKAAAAMTLDGEQCLGFVDTADLVVAVTSSGVGTAPPSGLLGRMFSLVHGKDVGHRVGGAVNASGSDALHTVPDSATLLDAALEMVRSGVNRLLVVSTDAHGAHSLSSLVSRTDVLRALNGHTGDLGAVAHAPMGALFPFASPPLTLRTTATLRDAFKQLQEHGFEGCAVVGEDGAIVGNVSVADVRDLAAVVLAGEDVEAVMGGSLISYLNRRGDGSCPRRAPVTSTTGDSLTTVLQLLCVAGVHRVHVVDALRRPIGVVTASDLLRVLLSPELTVHTDGEAPVAAGAGTPLAGAALSSLEALTAWGPHLHAVLGEAHAWEFAMGASGKHLVEVANTSSLADALQVMDDSHVSSVPVYVQEPGAKDESTPHRHAGSGWTSLVRRYIGWLDYADIAGFVLTRGVGVKPAPGALAALGRAMSGGHVTDADHTAETAMNFLGRDPMWSVSPDRSICKVIRSFAVTGARRLLVVDTVGGEARFHGIISQSGLVRFLRLRGDVMGPIAHVPVSDFLTLAHPHGSPAPITVPAAMPTRDALQTLVTHKVWGVPVLDDAGAVVANFSVSDVRHLAKATGRGEVDAALATPVLAFLRERHSALTVSPGGVVVRPSDTVSMVLQLLVEGHLHHVYVVDEARVPHAVLSLTDIMRALTSCMDP